MSCYGHGGEQVRAAFARPDRPAWAEQAQQLGTGHAVQQAMPDVPRRRARAGAVRRRAADHAETLRRLLAAPGRIAVLAADLADPDRLRPRRPRRRRPRRRASSSRRMPTTSSARSAWSTPASSPPMAPRCGAGSSTLRNDNAQGEYYLTDVFARPRPSSSAAEMVHVADPIETEGANDPWQLAQLERAFQLRAARALCVQGVRFADPARIDIRGDVQRRPRRRDRRRRGARRRRSSSATACASARSAA